MSHWGLLSVLTVTLAFLAWNLVLSGTAVREEPGFRAWSRGLCVVLCLALAASVALQARDAWREGLRRQAGPAVAGNPRTIRERSLRVPGSARPFIQHFVRELEKQFPRFYAFQRYRAPYLVYFYYAKKGAFSLFGLPFTKAGFLFLFVVGYSALSRSDGSAFREWERVMMAIGGTWVVFGLVIRAVYSFQRTWIQIVEDLGGVCLTLSIVGPSRGKRLERLWRSFDPHTGVVSRSTQSR